MSFTILSAYVIFNLFIGTLSLAVSSFVLRFFKLLPSLETFHLAGVVAQQMDEAKDRLTKENENRGNMVGCEDEFDEDERSARLIYLRYADLIDECHAVEVNTAWWRKALFSVKG